MNLGMRRGMSYESLSITPSGVINKIKPNRDYSKDGLIECTKNFHKKTDKRAKRRAKGKNK